jgi:hypothetical protein
MPVCEKAHTVCGANNHNGFKVLAVRRGCGCYAAQKSVLRISDGNTLAPVSTNAKPILSSPNDCGRIIRRAVLWPQIKHITPGDQRCCKPVKDPDEITELFQTHRYRPRRQHRRHLDEQSQRPIGRSAVRRPQLEIERCDRNENSERVDLSNLCDELKRYLAVHLRSAEIRNDRYEIDEAVRATHPKPQALAEAHGGGRVVGHLEHLDTVVCTSADPDMRVARWPS